MELIFLYFHKKGQVDVYFFNNLNSLIMKKNDLKIFSYAVISIFLISQLGCSKDDNPESELTTTIGGEEFTPAYFELKKYNNRLQFEFSEGSKKLKIVTNDTAAGAYLVQEQSLKSGGNSNAYLASIEFYDGNVNYNGFDGTVTITLEEQGAVTVDYEAQLKDAQNQIIEINNGSNNLTQYDILDKTSSVAGGSPDCIFNPNIDYGLLTDQQGNVYRTVTIGTNTWMAENLRATAYADGTAIPLVEDNDEWAALEDNNADRAYCWYNN
jgi:hypothetical protein